MKYFFIIFLFTMTSAPPGFGQDKSAEPTFFVDSSRLVWQYHSKVIGEDYTIYITLPDGYNASKTAYPVLYLTDGDWNMTVAKDCFDMLEQDYSATIPIIVGIGYGDKENKRGRDYEPKTGGPKFLSFIETEVFSLITALGIFVKKLNFPYFDLAPIHHRHQKYHVIIRPIVTVMSGLSDY